MGNVSMQFPVHTNTSTTAALSFPPRDCTFVRNELHFDPPQKKVFFAAGIFPRRFRCLLSRANREVTRHQHRLVLPFVRPRKTRYLQRCREIRWKPVRRKRSTLSRVFLASNHRRFNFSCLFLFVFFLFPLRTAWYCLEKSQTDSLNFRIQLSVFFVVNS